MQQQWDLLFHDLKQDLERYWRIGQTEKEKIESCFRIANRYWQKVREVLPQQFGSVAEEINFFRNIKPEFTSRIELYTLIYKAYLFAPAPCPVQTPDFWGKELKRLASFKNDNGAFVLYYESGQTECDKEWFRKRSGEGGNRREPSSSHDHLVSSLMAHRLYYDYVCEKMNEINDTAGRVIRT